MAKSCSYEVFYPRGNKKRIPDPDGWLRGKLRVFHKTVTSAKKAAKQHSKREGSGVISVHRHCATGTTYHYINCEKGICGGRYTKSRRIEGKRRKRAKQNRKKR